MHLKNFMTWFSCALVTGALTLACSSGDEGSDEPTVDVTVRGAYQVGIRTSSLTYTPEGLNSERSLRVVVWYPTNATEGDRGPYLGLGEALFDAPLVEERQFPILLYSHGTTSFAECAYDLMEFFASHGFVVASADHSGDTTADRDTPRTTEMFVQRPQDVSALLDWLYALPSDDPLSGRLTEDVALAGHSYGGWNVFATVGADYNDDVIDGCESDSSGALCSNMTPEFATILKTGFKDERFKVVIPMAPGNASLVGPSGLDNVDIPILLMTSTLDRNNPNDVDGDPYWAAMNREDALRVNYDKGGHHSYILTCELSPVIALENGGGCEDANTDFRTLLEATNVYSMAFTRYHLFGDQGMLPILQGEASTYEDVTITQK